VAATVVVFAVVGAAKGRAPELSDVPFGWILAIDMAAKVLSLGALAVALRIRGEPAGLGGIGPRPKSALSGGALSGLAFLPILVAVFRAQEYVYTRLDWKFDHQELIVEAARGSVTSFALVSVFAVLFAPIYEEIAFRGFLFSGLRARLGPFGAAVTTSLLFALFHANLDVLPVLFLLGLWLNGVRERTGGLMAPIAAHACYNAYQMAGVWMAR
jgi:membrane protease YdiL (CAAX protease family)